MDMPSGSVKAGGSSDLSTEPDVHRGPTVPIFHGLASGWNHEHAQPRVYVASSWRNPYQPEVVEHLLANGIAVYDFRHPIPGDSGFAWGDIAQEWQDWSNAALIEALKHPIAQAGFSCDMTALQRSTHCVLVAPCGRSAHLELGYAVGAGKKTAVLFPDEAQEPELMLSMCDFLTTSDAELVDWIVGE